jgi:hypothetical protein
MSWLKRSRGVKLHHECLLVMESDMVGLLQAYGDTTYFEKGQHRSQESWGSPLDAS